MLWNKRFRAVVCVLLAILTLIHTTPLYATSESDTTSGSDTTQTAGTETGQAGSTSTTTTTATTDTAGNATMDAGTGSGGADSGILAGSGTQQAPSAFLSTGAATYNIPIEVPPGRGGIAPNLSLSYNSYRGNGWVGVGWDLGMGAIQRATKKGMNCAANDYVATVNGSTSELVARFDDWGPDHYSNKIEGAFLKYFFDSSTGGWKVTDKSGTVYYYGKTPASRQPNSGCTFKWFLSRVEDLNGNYMTVSYQRYQGELYLSEIHYTGNVHGLTPSNSVVFELETRTDTIRSFVSHSDVKTAYRLKTISVYGNGQAARQYELSYLTSTRTSRSILQSVAQYGYEEETGEKKLLPDPITFEWQAGVSGFQAPIPLGSGEGLLAYHQIADVNRDGMVDEIYEEDVTASPSSPIKVRRSEGDGVAADAVWGHRDSSYGGGGFFLADIDGDGYPEVVYSGLARGIHVLKNNGARFLTDTVKATRVEKLTIREGGMLTAIRVADVNGDGRADLVYEAPREEIGPDGQPVRLPGAEIRVLLGRADGGLEADTLWGIRAIEYGITNTDGITEEPNRLKMADVNGDGLPDCIYYGTDSKFHVLLSTGAAFTTDVDWVTRQVPFNTYYKGFQVADVNGDGLADIIYNGCASCGQNPPPAMDDFRVALSTGSSFLPDTPWGTRDLYFTTSYFIMADVNGDGLADLLYDSKASPDRPAVYTGFQVHLSTGTGFAPRQMWALRENGADFPFASVSMSDFNGDGLLDFIHRDPGDSFSVRPSTLTFPDLISKIKNGIGGSYTIDYLRSSFYQNGYLPYVVQTVSSIRADDGNGNASTTSYTYSGGLHDVLSREFRGFSYVKQKLPNLTTVESQFHQGDFNKGLMYNQKVKNPAGVLYKEVINQFEERIVFQQGSDPPLVVFPRLTQVTEDNYDGETTAVRVRTTLEYDPYGNMLWKYQAGDVAVTGDERYDAISYEAYYDTTLWILSRPHETITKRTPGAQLNLSKTTYVYWPDTNLVHTKTFWFDEKRFADGDDPFDPVITYIYDDYGNLHLQYDPGSIDATVILYDIATQTFPNIVTNPKGHEVIYADYDYRFGKPKRKTDTNLNVTAYKYDAFGRLAKVAVGPNDTLDLPTAEYIYSSGTVGQQNVTVSLREVSGTEDVYNKSTYYDGFGREIFTLSEGAGTKIIRADTTYDANGKVWKKSLPYFTGSTTAGEVVSTYDCLGRPATRVSPAPSTPAVLSVFYAKKETTYIQGSLPNDPNGHKRVEVRDTYGRVTSVTEYASPAESFTTAYLYSALGNLTKVTDAQGFETTIVYDTLSRKRQMTDPNMGTWIYRYYASGNLKIQTDAKGQTVTFEYEELNRPSHKRYPDGTEVVYNYDTPEPGLDQENTKGRPTKVTDASGNTTTFSYDYAGRVTVSTCTIDGYDYTVKKTYDDLGRMTSIRYPDNALVNYTYDNGGNTWMAGSYGTFLDYNAMGQPGRIKFRYDGAEISTTLLTYYAENGRLKDLTTPANGSAQHFSYEYDKWGNITSINDHNNPSQYQEFTYDGLNRLLTAQSPSYSPITMEYDTTGNITRNSRVGDTDYEYYATHPQRVRTAGANNYLYDANGNMTNRNDQEIHYDYDNRVSSISRGGATTSYVYNYAGARVKKITPTDITIYVGNLFEKTNGIATRHIFAGGRRIASRITSGNNEGTYYHHPDHLGSLSLVIKPDTTSAQTATYYPFGEIHTETNPDLFHNKFTGQEQDPESGLYYYGARYYDPALGRFISPDSIVQAALDPQTLNRYSYCRNNPLVYADPSGHFFMFAGLFGFPFLFGAFMGAALSKGDPMASMMGGLTASFSAGMTMGLGAMIGPLAQGLASVTSASFANVISATAVGMGTGGFMAAGMRQDVLKAAITAGAFAGVSAAFGELPADSGPSSARTGVRVLGEQDEYDMQNEFITERQAQRVVDVARAWKEAKVPYKYGGQTRAGADCSGSISGIYEEAGLGVGRINTSSISDSPYFEPSPGNIPRAADVGVWAGRHAVLYDPKAAPGMDLWTAHYTGGPNFGPADLQVYINNYGQPQWYRRLSN
ncbi:MAG: toxin TcdB middle/N-terminal domain-containing protein [Syntrophobacteraceae bacterium]